MRRFHYFLLPLCLFVGQASLRSQGKNQTSGPAPEVGGKTMEYWIGQIHSKDQSKSETAIQTVLLFGPERAYQAVPAILDRLRKHTASAPVDVSIRVNGVLALGIILGGIKDGNPKTIKDSVAIIRRFLTDNQSIIRFRATQALGRIGLDAKEAIPDIIPLVKDISTFENRQAACVTLGQISFDKINGPSLSVLNALYGALGDMSVQVRLAAVQSLYNLGAPVNPTARIGLLKALDPVSYKDPEPTVKIWAHMAVMWIGRHVDKERVDAIAFMVSGSEAATRSQAIQALGSLGKDAKSAIPVLMKSLSDPDPMIVAWSAWALGRMGNAASGALPALERIKADTTQLESVRKIAEDAIDLITGKKN